MRGFPLLFDRFRHLDRRRIFRELKVMGVSIVRTAIYLGFAIVGLAFILNIIGLLIQRRLLDIPTLITLWVAEVPLAWFLTNVLRLGEPDRPELIIEEKMPSETLDGATYYRVVVLNKGRIAAESCLAKLSIEDKTDNAAETKLPSELGLHWFNRETNEVTIRPDDKEQCDVLKVTKLGDSHSLHFEIPHDKDWIPMAPKTYNGSIKVSALNCKSALAEIKIGYNQKKQLVTIVLNSL